MTCDISYCINIIHCRGGYVGKNLSERPNSHLKLQVRPASSDKCKAPLEKAKDNENNCFHSSTIELDKCGLLSDVDKVIV